MPNPTQPEARHVADPNEYATTQTGLVLQWQYTPVRKATAAWSALVLVAPFPEAVLLQWV